MIISFGTLLLQEVLVLPFRDVFRHQQILITPCIQSCMYNSVMCAGELSTHMVQNCEYCLLCVCRFERCWPAMAKDTHGVVLVHNPDQPQHEKELERWSEKQQQLGAMVEAIYSSWA